MHILKTLKDTVIDGVDLEADHQYNINTITPDMRKAESAGEVSIKEATTTLAERRSDIAALKLPK